MLSKGKEVPKYSQHPTWGHSGLSGGQSQGQATASHLRWGVLSVCPPPLVCTSHDTHKAWWPVQRVACNSLS